jgi:serine/threonine protein phosphatase PrpC
MINIWYFKYNRGFGYFGYIKSNEYSQLANKIFSNEPDILEYDLKEDDEYIFMGTESIIECIDKKKFQEIMKDDISETLDNITKDNISSNFYNNDTEFGFDNITCTLIQIKKVKKNE